MADGKNQSFARMERDSLRERIQKMLDVERCKLGELKEKVFSKYVGKKIGFWLWKKTPKTVDEASEIVREENHWHWEDIYLWPKRSYQRRIERLEGLLRLTQSDEIYLSVDDLSFLEELEEYNSKKEN